MIALLALGTLLMSACTSTTETSTGETTDSVELPAEIVIGGIAPLSGDAVSLGLPMQRAGELAVADINAAWAEAGHTFTIKWEDGMCSGQGGASAAQKLVNVDGMDVILGGLCSGETLAAAPITEAAGTLLMSPSASSPEVTTAGDLVYRTWPSDQVQGEKLAQMAMDLGYESVGMIYIETDYAAGIARVFEETYEGTIHSESALSDAVDYKTEITRLKSEAPDVYFLSTQTDVEGDVILKQMQELGIEGPFLLNDVIGTHVPTLEKYAEYLEGSYTATFAIDEESEEVQSFQQRYLDTYEEEASYLAYMVSFYETVWMLANAIQEVGMDPEALQAHFDDYEGHTGMTGEINFDDNGDLAGGHSIFMIEGGSLVMQ